MERRERLVTVLVTLAVPDTADADDAATLIAVAVDSTDLTVSDVTTILRGDRRWTSITANGP